MATSNLGAIVYAAKQTAKGSPAATATFAHGLTGGKPIHYETDVESIGIATSLGTELGALATADRPLVAVESLAHAKSVGLWLLAALGSVASAGTGPYTHTFTRSVSAPYLTVWGSRLSAAEKQRVSDVRLSELGLEWDGTAPVKLSLAGVGLAAVLESANPGTPTVDESATTNVLTPAGGTFKVDVSGSSPATATVKSGSVKLSGLCEPVYGCDSVQPADVLPKVPECEVSLTLLADDFAAWREALTGLSTGGSRDTHPDESYGSFELTFATRAGDDTLKLEAQGVAFACDVPDVDTAAGPVEIEVAGVIYGAVAANWLKATLSNQQASY